MQDTTGKTAEASSQLDSFRPVEGGQETGSATTFLVAAYVIIWVVAVGFILMTYRRQRALREQVDRLEAAIKARQD